MSHLSLSSRDEHVNGVDLVQLEVVLLVLLPLGLAGVLDDGLLAVDFVLLQLVREHPLDGLALVALADLLDGVRDGVGLEGNNRYSLDTRPTWLNVTNESEI